MYVIYYDDKKKPIGKSIFQLLEYDSATFNYDTIPCKVGNTLLRKFLNKKITILIAGNIFATGKSFDFNKEIPMSTIFSVMNKVVNALYKSNKTINYTIFKEFIPSNKNANLLVKKYKYIQFHIDDTMEMKLNTSWKKFEDLLKEFKTKYRSRSKQVVLKSSVLKVRELTKEDVEENANKIEDLYQQVLKNSNFNIGVFNVETFIRLKEKMPKYYFIYGYFLENELIGFRTLFKAGKVLEASFIGIDYTKNLKYNLYQRMLIDYVEYGIANKMEKINFGRTAETIKSCVGAEPVRMNLYVKARKKTGKFLLKLIINNIRPTEFSLRRPFKKIHYK